jgi:LysR family glycine cleavage system transcriptional activator
MANLNAFHLTGLRAVEAVARCGSLQKAADELGVSISAVSQQVGRTEKQLGHTIFERSAAGLRPTPFGREFAARLGAGFREISGALALAEETGSNTLVVSVAPSFASKWLLPRLSRHFELYPDVLLRIDASTRLADPNNSDVDIGIRLGRGNWPGVRAEKLLDLEILPVLDRLVAAREPEVARLQARQAGRSRQVKVGLQLAARAGSASMTGPVAALPLVRRIAEHAYKAGAGLVTPSSPTRR